ncbi:TetR/AcrR family transcriptional regulator [Pseudonocardia humida]|uniref:TetR/AcrR family transcriptional regulator n=1 Tax=Pseudonocardia humida TaxID=2800819 RepID=A0ABT0ZVS5_9PSEU|nr:TetR/AcrR family transcriptional regulator [Pseudonocardia humida]MCO1654849.1 TetR/AcrR family transcriptional regulator [Pseudonocardia humida]
MSPQRSNRAQLVEGTLRCLERLPPERITARAIAEESAANLASITYHFGSKDALVTAAVIEGLDRWLDEIAGALQGVDPEQPGERFRRAFVAVEGSRQRHLGLARTLVAALARAQHDAQVREMLAEGFRRSRRDVATVLGLGTDQAGLDAAGLALAQFNGLLFQTLLDPDLAVPLSRWELAQARLRPQ